MLVAIASLPLPIIVYPVSCHDIHVFQPFLMFPHVLGYSCPIDSLTVKLINKKGWIGMSTGGEYQELFQKGRIGMSIGHEYPVT